MGCGATGSIRGTSASVGVMGAAAWTGRLWGSSSLFLVATFRDLVATGGSWQSSSLFLVATLRDLASGVMWACSMSIKRCSTLVWLSLSRANDALMVGDCRACTMSAMPARM